MRIQKLGLQIRPNVDFEIVNNESDPRFKEYWTEYFSIMKRRGITQEQAQRAVISDTTVIGAIMVHRGEADAMICGTIGDYHEHFSVVQEIFGYREGVQVSRLIRVRYGDIPLPKGLPRGGYTELDLAQTNYLRELVGLTPETASKVAVEKDRRRMKANQIRRAVKRHSQVSGNRQTSGNRRSGGRSNNG